MLPGVARCTSATWVCAACCLQRSDAPGTIRTCDRLLRRQLLFSGFAAWLSDIVDLLVLPQTLPQTGVAKGGRELVELGVTV